MAAKTRNALKGFLAAAVGAIGFGGMSAAGFTSGAESGIEGLDGSTVRDTVTGALTLGSLFVPQLGVVANVIKSLTNHKAVETVTETTAGQNELIADLSARVDDLESLESVRNRSLKRRVTALEKQVKLWAED